MMQFDKTNNFHNASWSWTARDKAIEGTTSGVDETAKCCLAADRQQRFSNIFLHRKLTCTLQAVDRNGTKAIRLHQEQYPSQTVPDWKPFKVCTVNGRNGLVIYQQTLRESNRECQNGNSDIYTIFDDLKDQLHEARGQ